MIAVKATAQDFPGFLVAVEKAPAAARSALVDSFLASHPVLPLLEGDSIVHFLYRGTAHSLAVTGDANGWNATASRMTRVSTTDLWYGTHRYEPDARLDYKFVVDGTTWILDPANPQTAGGGFGPNSELRMPRYVPPRGITSDPSLPHGTVRDTSFTSSILRNRRTVHIYLPPGYDRSTRRYPLLLVHDGLDYLTLGGMRNTLDYCIAHKRITPLIAVFVPPVNRGAEYAGAQMKPFAEFLVREVLPSLTRRYRIDKRASAHATMGASNGGNIALYLGYTYPHVFGNVAAQSSNIIESITRGFAESPRRDLRLYLDLGTYDLPGLIPLVRSFIPVIREKGYPFRYRELHEGHSWGSWRARIGEALAFFFPGEAFRPTDIPSSSPDHRNNNPPARRRSRK